MIWQELTSPALGRIDRSTPVILPVAAIEQHGAHLPVATDRLIGEWLCAELEREISEQVLVLPAVAVGCSEHHLDFPGSLSLRHETFAAVLEEILDSVAHHGFRNLIILNSHGGNQGIGQVVAERWGWRHPQHRLVFTSWWRLAAPQLIPLNETGPGGVGHACEFETSLIQVIAPKLVDQKRIAPGQNVPTFAWAEGDLLRGARASLYRTMKSMTPSGVYGQPQAATSEKGLAIRDAVVKALKEVVLDLGSAGTFADEDKKKINRRKRSQRRKQK